MASQKNNILFIAGLALISILVLLPTFVTDGLPLSWPSKAIRLGLDLKGGSYLVLGVQTDEAVKSHLNSVSNSIRLDLKKEKIGLIRSKARFRSLEEGGKVELTMLGQKGVNRLREYISSNYPELQNPEIQEKDGRSVVSYSITQDEIKEIEKQAVVQAIETIRNRVDQYGVAEPVIQRVGKKRIMVQLPDITNLDTVKQTIGSVAKLEFRLVPQAAGGGTTLPSREGFRTAVDEDVLMTGDAVDGASVEINPQTNELEVTMKFNSVGAKTFGQITSEYVGRQFAIILDGVVQSAPVIREPILGGRAQISGGFSKAEAHNLAVVLRSGALPAPLTFEEERTVGASLGKDSITKGIYSMAIGSLLVVIFTAFYYKKSGLLAVTCLLLNVLLLLSLLAVLGATLTLPGIAGLILTVGMAVDANVIIFERIREELRKGVSSMSSVRAGFNKAHWTILDANITTLITGLVLYSWGTGPIKGFAVTLCLGVITSMFTALFVAKVGFHALKLTDGEGALSI